MDNHRAHLSNENVEFIEEKFKMLRTPIYSCGFNSIETLWSQFKRIFKQKQAI